MGDLRQRNYVIDFAKAIAIVLVVIGHWYPATSPAWWMGIRDVIYSFHMPLFMAASGYIYIYMRIYPGVMGVKTMDGSCLVRSSD